MYIGSKHLVLHATRIQDFFSFIAFFLIQWSTPFRTAPPQGFRTARTKRSGSKQWQAGPKLRTGEPVHDPVIFRPLIETGSYISQGRKWG